MEKVGIIIPAHNEEKRIGETLKVYSEFFENLKKTKQADCLLFVVINGSNDRTNQIVTEFSKKHKILDFIDLKRGGKGYAVTQGFNLLLQRDFDLIGFVDADLATSPEEFYKLIQNIKHSDAIIASRYLKNSKVFPKATFRRLIVSRVFNILIRTLLFLPYRDTQCGAKLFKKESIKKALPKITFSQWAFDVDLLYQIRKLGFQIREFPTVWVDKEYSKINFWRSGPWMALAIIRLRLIHSPFKGFVKFYDAFLSKLWK